MNPLFTQEIKALREKASRGVDLTIEEVKAFIAAKRVSWLALPGKKEKAEKPAKAEKPKVDEKDIDFF